MALHAWARLQQDCKHTSVKSSGWQWTSQQPGRLQACKLVQIMTDGTGQSCAVSQAFNSRPCPNLHGKARGSLCVLHRWHSIAANAKSQPGQLLCVHILPFAGTTHLHAFVVTIA